jgi:oligopeptidase A
MNDNPLLGLSGLPPFSRIRPEHAEPAVRQLIEANRQALAERLAAGGPYTWENLVDSLESHEDALERAFAPVSHLSAVCDSPAWREAYNACLPLLSAYATEVGQNEALYQAYQSLADQADELGLDAAQRRVIDNALRDFRLAGVALPMEQKARFKEIVQALSLASNKFSENILDATNAWTRHLTDASALAGLPASALDQLAQNAAHQGLEGYLVTLQGPSYLAVMTYADDRELRREVYTAYATRASDQGPHAGRWDNAPLIDQILALRHEAAQMLGFANYAEESLATKMAPDVDSVEGFLLDLAARARPVAEAERNELAQFAKSRSSDDFTLEPWDVAYWSEKLRLARHRLSEEELRPYFPAPRVIDGLFSLIGRLFGVHFEPVETTERWHPQVQLYALRDAQGHPRGHVYLDLYARPEKRGGAWMADAVSRRRIGQTVQLPVAFIVGNFTPPVGQQAALLTHDEVLTLFHEFGHGLHHLLTEVDHLPVSGIHGVEWDAVELPSQFMENWAWQRDVLDLISGHVETGEPLPDSLFERMIDARNFQMGMQFVRQIEFSLFDLRLHRTFDPSTGGRVQAILEAVRREVAVIHPPAWHRFPNSFSHIFAGGYAAGYYSYKWAEVLSADAFAAFEEAGLFDPVTGRRFLREILEVGGSRPAAASFEAFRGREPTIEALLRHSGIAA